MEPARQKEMSMRNRSPSSQFAASQDDIVLDVTNNVERSTSTKWQRVQSRQLRDDGSLWMSQSLPTESYMSTLGAGVPLPGRGRTASVHDAPSWSADADIVAHSALHGPVEVPVDELTARMEDALAARANAAQLQAQRRGDRGDVDGSDSNSEDSAGSAEERQLELQQTEVSPVLQGASVISPGATRLAVDDGTGPAGTGMGMVAGLTIGSAMSTIGRAAARAGLPSLRSPLSRRLSVGQRSPVVSFQQPPPLAELPPLPQGAPGDAGPVQQPGTLPSPGPAMSPAAGTPSLGPMVGQGAAGMGTGTTIGRNDRGQALARAALAMGMLSGQGRTRGGTDSGGSTIGTGPGSGTAAGASAPAQKTAAPLSRKAMALRSAMEERRAPYAFDMWRAQHPLLIIEFRRGNPNAVYHHMRRHEILTQCRALERSNEEQLNQARAGAAQSRWAKAGRAMGVVAALGFRHHGVGQEASPLGSATDDDGAVAGGRPGGRAGGYSRPAAGPGRAPPLSALDSRDDARAGAPSVRSAYRAGEAAQGGRAGAGRFKSLGHVQAGFRSSTHVYGGRYDIGGGRGDGVYPGDETTDREGTDREGTNTDGTEYGVNSSRDGRGRGSGDGRRSTNGHGYGHDNDQDQEGEGEGIPSLDDDSGEEGPTGGYSDRDGLGIRHRRTADRRDEDEEDDRRQQLGYIDGYRPAGGRDNHRAGERDRSTTRVGRSKASRGHHGHGTGGGSEPAASLLQARDLRIVDPEFEVARDPAILARRHCLVVNLPPVRAIILPDRCYFFAEDGIDADLAVALERFREHGLKAARKDIADEKRLAKLHRQIGQVQGQLDGLETRSAVPNADLGLANPAATGTTGTTAPSADPLHVTSSSTSASPAVPSIAGTAVAGQQPGTVPAVSSGPQALAIGRPSGSLQGIELGARPAQGKGQAGTDQAGTRKDGDGALDSGSDHEDSAEADAEVNSATPGTDHIDTPDPSGGADPIGDDTLPFEFFALETFLTSCLAAFAREYRDLEPVLERLTGGTGMPPPLLSSSARGLSQALQHGLGVDSTGVSAAAGTGYSVPSDMHGLPRWARDMAVHSGPLGHWKRVASVLRHILPKRWSNALGISREKQFQRAAKTRAFRYLTATHYSDATNRTMESLSSAGVVTQFGVMPTPNTATFDALRSAKARIADLLTRIKAIHRVLAELLDTAPDLSAIALTACVELQERHRGAWEGRQRLVRAMNRLAALGQELDERAARLQGGGAGDGDGGDVTAADGDASQPYGRGRSGARTSSIDSRLDAATTPGSQLEGGGTLAAPAATAETEASNGGASTAAAPMPGPVPTGRPPLDLSIRAGAAPTRSPARSTVARGQGRRSIELGPAHRGAGTGTLELVAEVDDEATPLTSGRGPSPGRGLGHGQGQSPLVQGGTVTQGIGAAVVAAPPAGPSAPAGSTLMQQLSALLQPGASTGQGITGAITNAGTTSGGAGLATLTDAQRLELVRQLLLGQGGGDGGDGTTGPTSSTPLLAGYNGTPLAGQGPAPGAAINDAAGPVSGAAGPTHQRVSSRPLTSVSSMGGGRWRADRAGTDRTGARAGRAGGAATGTGRATYRQSARLTTVSDRDGNDDEDNEDNDYHSEGSGQDQDNDQDPTQQPLGKGNGSPLSPNVNGYGYGSPISTTTMPVVRLEPLREAAEVLLEAYLAEVESLMARARLSRDALDGAENSLNLVLASNRNRLLRVEIFISTVGAVMGLCTVVGGFYGMNVTDVTDWQPDKAYGSPWLIVVVATCVASFVVLLAAWAYLRTILN